MDKDQLIKELEDKWDALNLEYMTMENKDTADYFLALGKASQLGEVIDFITDRH